MPIVLLLAAVTANVDPLRFFVGATRGEGELKVVFHARVPVSVQGSGHLEAGDTLVLDQVVSEAAKPPRERHWRLRQVLPGRYEGTLTDARGTVVGDVDGPHLHLRFTIRNGLRVQQWLTLATNGRSATNRLVVRKFGVTVATLDEKILKVD